MAKEFSSQLDNAIIRATKFNNKFKDELSKYDTTKPIDHDLYNTELTNIVTFYCNNRI